MPSAKQIRRIATEEAFCTPEVADGLAQVARAPGNSLDLVLMQMIYDAQGKGRMAHMRNRLLDLEGERLAEMDEYGVAMHILSLTAPGVQMFDADTATELAALANDRLAETIARHPTRFAGLAAVAPQSPKRAAREMERAINTLKLNGFVINSHTNDEYLDDPKFFPLLEAAEALDACIYIHPRAPSAGFDGPLRHYAMDGAMWGFGLEVSTHVLRLILSGVFDRFPRLKICIGHMGEALHFWQWRIDYMSRLRQNAGQAPRLQLEKPSAYMKRNLAITTSGVEDSLALDYSLKALGEDNVMWAIDYPYQPTAPAVQWMDSAPVSEETRAKLYYKNAERIFRIRPEA
jgi:2,3-dihydroxybenzoate decarboxylase/5-carboxyvanillate decarboxylase